MTYKEVIEMLDYIAYCNDYKHCREAIAIDMAKVASEKQIAQKVKYNNRHGEGYDLWNKDYYNCPTCGRRLRNKQHDPYCPKCGQALKWEE